jgi:RimJ/RimL family protein N-acetyltransferase
MAEHPIEPFWKAWFVSLQSPAFPASSVDVPTLVGTIGFKGPPGPPASDTHGVIEVGYSVVTSHWRRGIASEGVAALLAWAGDDPRVRTFRAHTLANDPASAGVLLRNHFTRTATLNDPDDGLIDRYERPAVSP